MATSRTPTTAPTPEQVRAGWDRIASGFDAFTTPVTVLFGERVLRRVELSPGTRVLDVAAGSGALALPAARRGAHVVATDISPVMLERLRARARAEGLTEVDTRVMDAHALDLHDDSFDVAVSQHGVSLLPDIDRGLREMVRVTRRGGRVLVVAFGPLPQAEFLTFLLGALRAAVPGFSGPPTDPPPAPFQVADPEVLHGKLSAAGLVEVDVERAVWDLPVRSAAHHWDVVTSSNPIGAELVADLTEEQTADALHVLEGMLREHSGGSPDTVLHNAVNIGVGVVP